MNPMTTFISVILVLVILIGFVLTIAIFLSRSTFSKIQEDMNRIISAYDSIIEAKTKSIEQLELQKEQLNKKVENIIEVKQDETQNEKLPAGTINNNSNNIPISSFITSSASYRNDSLASGYETIKNNFSFSEDQIRTNVINIKETKAEDSTNQIIKRLLSELEYNSIYDLIIKDSKSQLEYFRNKYTGEYQTLLDQYLKEIEDTSQFDSVRYYDWLKRKAQETSTIPKVRTSARNSEEEFDPSICDGYQIYVGNKMYDYSISKKDVS